MSRRLHSVWLIGALLTFASGCTTFTRVSPREGLSQSQVEVYFATPQRIVARQAGAEVVRRNVTRLAGRALEVRGDTLVLEIRRWEASGSWMQESPPLIAALPASDASTIIGTRRISGWRTAAVILGPPVIAFTLLFILCSIDPCLT
jgi:hypothetical protein